MDSDLERIEAAFALLPAGYQRVLWWRRVEGLDYVEIGSRLGISERAVERKMARAIYALAAAVGRLERRGRCRTAMRRFLPF